MTPWAPWIRRMLALPKWQAVSLIVGASVGGSVLLTLIIMTLLGAPQKTFLIALGVALGVPTLVAGPVGIVLMRLLHELDSARILAQTLANTDALTGALNRRNFMEVGTLVVARARHDATPMSVLMLDVDDFKRVNDQYGHGTGDEVLQMFARVCMQTLRPTDMLARWGGEEFVALLPSTAPADAIQISERLCNAIASGSVAAGTRDCVRVTVSIGVASSADSNTGLDELLSRADSAMYEAKRSGKNGVRLAHSASRQPVDAAA